jgi:arylsulfatase A-like enzyme
VLLATAASTILFNNCTSKVVDRRPNVLLILTDDLRADAIGISGNSQIITPNIDALGRAGKVYDKAFVTTSICGTSRASIITGEYARRHGMWTSNSYEAKIVERGFPSVLHKNGYYSSYIGKWGLGGPIPDGEFDFSYTFNNGKKYFHQNQGDKHLTEYLGDMALNQLNQIPDKPFCMVFATKAPHAQDGSDWPFQSDPKFKDLYENTVFESPPNVSESAFENLPEFLKTSEGRSRWKVRFGNNEAAEKSRKDYYRLVTGIDTQVGRLIEALKNKGVYDNTLIIFTSDNGMMLGEHGLSGKWWMFEESIKIPLIIKLPKDFNHELTHDTLPLNIDLHPTILEVCGVKPAKNVQGVSLLKSKQNPPRTSFFYEHLYDYKPIAKSEGVRTNEIKYINYLTTGTSNEMLFDLSVDPFELNNLVDSEEHAPHLKLMRQKHEAYKTLLTDA